ncbi:ABC transporter substrate-binding protein [Amorphoplanes nipponensis]|uniref:ABC transporter substrate-binding protein n=1 Tax=Actinoplanes nipponensis TaxID=135950 RepID=A0A919JLA7_9ACTN|nr:ABC transporter substrate-binding protein [Actinoplanes nipponensis]GIE51497.1 ABC transporter substrate-binding protein [Actinoplanes nipponensis]
MKPRLHPPRSRTRYALAGLLTVALIALSGCSGSSLDNDQSADGTIRIGLIWPKTGPYQALGVDMERGWQLYLDSHGGKLGGHTIATATGDEGVNQATALTAAKKLLDADRATVLVGTASADPTVAIAPIANQRKVPFIGTGGRPGSLKPADLGFVWHTSWQSRETGAAVAEHVRTAVNGPVYVMAPDYQGGWDQLGGFVEAFKKSGGTLANPDGKETWTPWGSASVNFLPYLNKIKDSGAKAVYVFFAGTMAVDFVKQYKQSGLALPLYGAGFLTEGAVLNAEGAAADGVQTVMNYVPDLDNPANRTFSTAYQQKYQQPPSIYSVTAWDAALLLDQAIAAAGTNPTSESINTAVSKLGALDSPRGSFRLGTVGHSPVQAWYLRKVAFDGRTRANVTQQTLTTLGS